MNGIHDVGGMDGFGVPDVAADEPVFHHEWEGVVYSLQVAGLGNGLYNIDEFRHAIERMPPEDYLRDSYYDRWLRAITRLLAESGEVDLDELEARTEAFEAGEASVPEREDPDLPGRLKRGVVEAYASDHEPKAPRFAVGDEVVVRNVHPEGHTRCPRYVRRARGVVRAHRGTHVLPDASADGEERAEPLYNVAFDAAELPTLDDRTRVSLDLWESYLEPAGTDKG